MAVAARKEASAPDLPPLPAVAVDVSRPNSALPLADALRRMAAEGGQSPTRLMQDFAVLAFGPGKISFNDYTRLRLFDHDLYAGVDRRAFVGARMNRDLCVTINHRHDWLGMLSNKVASIGYLSAYGLPCIPVVGLYHEGLATGGATILRDARALRAFLMVEEHYPLFGKPTESVQSLGSAGLRRFLPLGNMLEFVDGRLVGLDTFVDDITRHYAGGYLFQPLTLPPAAIRDVCGERLPTIRVLTATTEAGPTILRASWKIQSGGNVADNYWRTGNLLAQLDLDTGAVRRAFSGAGFSLAEVTHHPDTGAALVGVTVPHWQEVRRVALEGARLMRHVPLIGWDMGATEEGAVIVEMNETPDFSLHQLADGRGMLDAGFAAFMAFQKGAAGRREAQVKAELARL